MQDFVYYNSGNESPPIFHQWAALALLGAVLGRKASFAFSPYFKIHGNLYVVLVGTAGSGKSTAKSNVKEIFIEEFPDLMISDSIQSREDIIKKMGSDECECTILDPNNPGKFIEYRPFFAIVNEFASFLSVDKQKMVEFLVDIFDENHFSTGFKGDPNTKQKYKNPYFSILACATPNWIMTNLKLDLFEGGLGRRLIIVYAEKKKCIAKPKLPPGAEEAQERVLNHLRKVRSFTGEFTMTQEADDWWVKWYEDPKRKTKDNPIMAQFHETKHVMVLKVAMLLALNELPLNAVIDKEHLEVALAMISELEPEVVRLTGGIGRNELAGISAKMLDTILVNGECIGEKRLKANYFRDLQTPEYVQCLNHLVDTGQVYRMQLIAEGDTTQREYVMTPKYHARLQEKFGSKTNQSSP